MSLAVGGGAIRPPAGAGQRMLRLGGSETSRASGRAVRGEVARGLDGARVASRAMERSIRPWGERRLVDVVRAARH